MREGASVPDDAKEVCRVSPNHRLPMMEEGEDARDGVSQIGSVGYAQLFHERRDADPHPDPFVPDEISDEGIEALVMPEHVDDVFQEARLHVVGDKRPQA